MAVAVGDHYANEEKIPKAEVFYQIAFGWDNKNEDLYNKLLRILGAQGKSM